MKWNEETTLKFVELYEENSCLWDVSSINYRNKQMRDSAINKIIQEMNIEDFGPQDVKNKIKNLRTTYSQECAKVEKRKKYVYIPAMKWFRTMNRFMKNVEARRSSKRNLTTFEDDDTQKNDPTSPTNSNNTESAETLENSSDVKKNNIVNAPKNNENKSTKTTPFTIKKRKHQDDRVVVEEFNHLNSTSLQPELEETECDVFGKYTAIQLKQLSPEDSLLAQQEIQSILTGYRVQSIRRLQSEDRVQSENSLQSESMMEISKFETSIES